MFSSKNHNRTIATKIKDKIVKFEDCYGSDIQKKNVGVKKKIQLFEEKTSLVGNYQPINSSNLCIEDDVSRLRESITKDQAINSHREKKSAKIPALPPLLVPHSYEVCNKKTVITGLSTPELPRLPCFDSNEDNAKLNAEIACKPLWKGKEYLKQLSTEELINNLRIIEKLRESYIEEIKETSGERLHDIAIYREEEEGVLTPLDEELGLSELHDDKDGYIVEAYNAVGNELVISQLQFDHQEENAFENKVYTSEENNLLNDQQINDFVIESNWKHKNNDLRNSQYSEDDSEDSTYMSLKDCLSGTTLLYENTNDEETTTQSAKDKNVKININVTFLQQKYIPSEK